MTDLADATAQELWDAASDKQKDRIIESFADSLSCDIGVEASDAHDEGGAIMVHETGKPTRDAGALKLGRWLIGQWLTHRDIETERLLFAGRLANFDFMEGR